MASIDGTIKISTSEYRPCIVDGKEKALFHRWEDAEEKGRRFTAGIVEYESGRIDEVLPYKIKFLDSTGLFHEIAFPKE